MIAAAVMVSYQTAGKAARDAIFLAHYDVSQLPAMVIAAAAGAMVFSLLSLRWIGRFGPSRVVSWTFLSSGLLQIVEWFALPHAPRIVAPIVYLHIAALTAILGSGFWSVLSEEIHLREAKKLFARIAAWGTGGGVLGGLAAERMGAWFGTDSVLIQLGLSHLLCAGILLRFASAVIRRPSGSPGLSPWAALSQVPYLNTLALLVLLGAASGSALDFLFKSQARDVFGPGAELLRFLALFHTATSVLTIGLQWLITRVSLERYGLTFLTGSVPAVVGAGSLLSAAFPSFPLLAGTRLLEASTRVSLFRNGYELFYTPIPAREKRAVKTFIDVVCDRVGDIASSAVVQTALVAAPGAVRYTILGFVVVASAVSLRLASRLDKGYRVVVERGLLQRADQIDVRPVDEPSLASITLSGDTTAPVPVPAAPPSDPLMDTLRELRSANLVRVNAALRSLQSRPIDPILLSSIVSLLAWTPVADTARRLLIPQVPLHSGFLVDCLLDPAQDPAIRRRLPRILVTHLSQRVCDGLVLGLADSRFEVRYQCGRALDILLRKLPTLQLDPAVIFHAVVAEVSVNKSIWNSRRLIDEPDAGDEFSFLDDVLCERAHQSLEHVFSLLALVLPRDPVRTAFRAIHSGDRALCDLALEYLESAVPAHVRQSLWPVLETDLAQIPAETRRLAARDILLTERGLLTALKRIDDSGATMSEAGL